MQEFVREISLQFLKPIHECWQPSEYLPNLAENDWTEALKQFQAEARQIPDDLLVVLIGDMITEEALPSYQTWVNGLAGLKDSNGTGTNPWALWTRGWTAEENRHGDLLNRYLYLTGRVDMNAVEVTIQHLIRNGFDPLTENDPYNGLVYTSFQEHATKISHRNTAVLASKAGEKCLQTICGNIAGDEARHEKVYQSCMKKVFEMDPSGAMIAFSGMMRKKIIMPARLMDDGRNKNLFNDFSEVAQRIGVYTALDYVTILKHLLRIWNVPDLKGLTDEAAKAQEYLCTLPDRYTRLAERRQTSSKAKKKFSWIYDRET